jgi:hypothetical protein
LDCSNIVELKETRGVGVDCLIWPNRTLPLLYSFIQELSGAAHGKAAELKEKAAETHEQARQVASDTAGVRGT